MNKPAGIHPQPSPWRRPPECSQPEQVRAWRDPDEQVFLPAFWFWRLHAARRGVDTDVFSSPEGERGLARASREGAAKAICAICPVKAPCAAYALQHHERYGVWGGLTEHDRASRWPGGSRRRGPLSSRV
jgi:WhiB family transcriptional regulator, redox-sensing transcriptional regulator